MQPKDVNSKPRKINDEPSVWSTGLVFATLIILTALMFVLAKKIATEGVSPTEGSTDIRAKR